MENKSYLLLIDGNNLAHFLYTNLAPGVKMTDEMGELLIQHLMSYSRTYANKVSIELILDRMPKKPIAPHADDFRVLCADYPQTGDDLLLGQFLYHQIHHDPCLVITDDGEILEEVKSEGGNFLRVSDFVRRFGPTNPVFRDPDDLPRIVLPGENNHIPQNFIPLRTSIYFRIAEEQVKKGKPEKVFPASMPWLAANANGVTKTDLEIPIIDTIESNQSLPTNNSLSSVNENLVDLSQKAPITSDNYCYAIRFETWPLNEGARFLRHSFCDVHRAEYRDLLDSVNYTSLEITELRAIAELLRYTCGHEPEFSKRGSLIDRVRLALLNAHEDHVSVSELAFLTGLPAAGLSKKIKEKAGRWIKIVHRI